MSAVPEREGALVQLRGYGQPPAATLAELVERGERFLGYAYAYPHKTAYRPLPPRPLTEVWAEEDTAALFLYLHVPYCRVRCGFCNLFTTLARGGDEEGFLVAIAAQAEAVRRALPGARFARLALGGGTPTVLSRHGMERLFAVVDSLGAGALPSAVECSPETIAEPAGEAKVALLVERGAARVSIGVQSFDPAVLRALGRPQGAALARAALDRLAGRFPRLNVDLIYGAAGQDTASFLGSLEEALRWQPEELFLYPLYLRPGTGLARRGRAGWVDLRPEMHAEAAARLAAAGYEARSLRHFVRRGITTSADAALPEYRCQDDGMIGLGPGARSYTRGLHYSSEWAVGAEGVQDIVRSFIDTAAAPDAASASGVHTGFDTVGYGVELDSEEQRRRVLIQSLLTRAGLSLDAYRARFGTEVFADFPALDELVALDFHRRVGAHLVPTEAGLAHSDLVGPWLYSPAVRALSGSFLPR